ncbi:hypothetical protein ACE6H2_015836 [Prunus campanulata]
MSRRLDMKTIEIGETVMFPLTCCLFSIDGEPPFTSMSFRLISVLEGLGEHNREGLKKMPLCVALASEKEQGEDEAFFFFFFQWKME